MALDLVAVTVFAILGRRSHDRVSSVAGILETAAPFLVATIVAWVALRAWRRPIAVPTGLGVALLTVAVGMVIRRTAFDADTAASFVVVTTTVLVTAMVGWRVLAGRLVGGGDDSEVRRGVVRRSAETL